MELTAFDYGARTSKAKVVVTVLDVNDHAPHFVNGSTTIYLPESSEVGLPVYKVVALDEDIDANGLITYKYSPTVTDAAKRLFSLSATDGQIRQRVKYRDSSMINNAYTEQPY